VVHGHSDGIESEIYTGPNPRDDLPLSDLRADCVLLRLTWLGVPFPSLSLEGHGASQPAATGTDDASRQANRRVELVVVK